MDGSGTRQRHPQRVVASGDLLGNATPLKSHPHPVAIATRASTKGDEYRLSFPVEDRVWLDRWRARGNAEVPGQQECGSQPDDAYHREGDHRQAVGAAWGGGDAGDEDGPGDGGAKGGAEVGHTARET